MAFEAQGAQGRTGPGGAHCQSDHEVTRLAGHVPGPAVPPARDERGRRRDLQDRGAPLVQDRTSMAMKLPESAISVCGLARV